MPRIHRSLSLLALLVLAACAQPFGGDGAGSSGSGTAGATPPPDSPAYFTQVVGDRVLFEVDQATLTELARTTLNEQAEWLTANGAFTAVIEGHADEQGTREYNLALGARRAEAAREYLVARGVAPGRLKTVTYGKERPLEVCSEESCYSRNRRAVTVLAAGAGV